MVRTADPTKRVILATALFLGLIIIHLASASLLAQSPPNPPNSSQSTELVKPATTKQTKKRIDGPMRARILAALAGIVIFGFCIVGLAWLGGRMTRRMLKTNEEQRQRYLTTEQLIRDDWADKPLTEDERQRIFQGHS